MPATIRSEFALALNQVCSERGIDPAVVLESIKAAIAAAYRKDLITSGRIPSSEIPALEIISVELNGENGEANIIIEGKDVTPPGFGRIAAQTAKQVILQRIREAEKAAVIEDFTQKVGTIISGMILRFDGANVLVDIGRGEGVMPPVEQNPTERYRLNQRLMVYVAEIRQGERGSEVIVSRAHKGLVEGLFLKEVPEMQTGAAKIQVIAREAGGRTKVAVVSTQSGVDPVGSLVGQKGVRVQAVINEIGQQEKVDIIQYSEDPEKFIASALAPAKEIVVVVDEKNKSAICYVPDDQLSLAIGKDGQNVRLAVKVTGYRIDIKPKSQLTEVKEEKIEEKPKTKKTKTTKTTKKKSTSDEE